MAKSRIFGEYTPVPQSEWTPKYPEFATDARKTQLLEESKALGADAWVVAPPTSHVAAFTIHDNPKDIYGKFIGATISIQFKKPISTGQSFYRYYFDRNFAEARRVFDLLKNAEHPGEIVQSELIAKRVRYEPYG